MFGSSILDVAIGLIFVYLLLSIVCSQANEIIAGVLGRRAAYLEKAIKNILNSPDGADFASKFYRHHLIQGLVEPRTGRHYGRPSYIPSRTFALALLETIAPEGAANSPQTMDDMRRIVSNLPEDSPLKNALLPLINQAQDDLSSARANIEKWYDDIMERVSGWYKRYTQKALLVLASVAVVLANADSIMIANHLAHNSALRETIVERATVAAKNDASLQKGAPSAAATRLPQTIQEIQGLELPVGWSSTEKAANRWPWIANENPAGATLAKIFGLMLTILAVSQGAPFWFDVLNRLVNVRSAGQAPGETPKPPEVAPRPSTLSLQAPAANSTDVSASGQTGGDPPKHIT